jgi:hypothetical protein
MRFATGFVSPDHFRYPPTQFKGQNWRIRFGPLTEGSPITSDPLGNRRTALKEVFIIAKSETVARRVASNVVGAMTLLEGSSHLIPDVSDAFNWQDDPAPNVRRLHAATWSVDSFPLACRIAVRVSHRLRLQYALAKFKLSSETASVTLHEIGSREGAGIP